jgi:hypothetical protein
VRVRKRPRCRQQVCVVQGGHRQRYSARAPQMLVVREVLLTACSCRRSTNSGGNAAVNTPQPRYGLATAPWPAQHHQPHQKRTR